MRKLIIISMLAIVVLSTVACMQEKPVVITKYVIYPDALLEHDFTAKVFPIPPRYNPKGVINPFMTKEEHRVADLRNAKIAKSVVIKVPITTLTRVKMSKLNLTSVVVNHTFAYAFFTVAGSERCYKATMGDYIGKKGITIADITPGVVHLSDGDFIAIKR